MFLIYSICAVVLLVLFPTLRCAVFHPLLSVFYLCRDFWKYVRRKEYNVCGTGQLVGYTGLFGRGKTLSAVHKVVGMYRRFDGKKVWCPSRKKIVTQRIKVISNVSLKIPYEDFKSLQQIVDAAKNQRQSDEERDELTVILVLGDEFSVQMNSRNFKENIEAPFLNALLTCRHYHLSIFYTAQRFNQVDALLRQVTSFVVDCDKWWRFQRQSYFDAWELENAPNPRLLTPYARTCWFIRDRDFEEYDTLAVVEDLDHRVRNKEMIPAEEILARQHNQGVNMDAVAKPSRRWVRGGSGTGKRR